MHFALTHGLRFENREMKRSERARTGSRCDVYHLLFNKNLIMRRDVCFNFPTTAIHRHHHRRRRRGYSFYFAFSVNALSMTIVKSTSDASTGSNFSICLLSKNESKLVIFYLHTRDEDECTRIASGRGRGYE